MTKGLDLYPNPATDQIFVTLKGFTEEYVDLVITNSIGEIVRTIKSVATKSINELKLNGLTPGLYNLKVNNHENNLNKRFIKMDNSY